MGANTTTSESTPSGALEMSTRSGEATTVHTSNEYHSSEQLKQTKLHDVKLPGDVKDLANSKVQEVNPYPNPGIFSLLVFSWLDKMIKHAYAMNKEGKNIDGTDLWELRQDMRSEAGKIYAVSQHSSFRLLAG